MQVVYSRCAGLDVHKKRISACIVARGQDKEQQFLEEGFGASTRELHRLTEWLRAAGVLDVAMEATGPYWRPVWNILEAAGLQLTLANPAHIRAIPGHKTDRHDARWIASLHQYGLVPASFVPSAAMRHLRDVTRLRTKVVQDHSRVVLRLQAVLEDANIKLASVVSDLRGVSAQDILKHLVGGQRDPAVLAELARGSLKRKRAQLQEALEGHFTPHHGFVVHRLLLQALHLEQQQRALEKEIERRLDDEQREVMALWDTIPGVNAKVAACLVAELGIRPEQFPDAGHAASWVALCPGNHVTGGKSKSGKTRKGNRWLRGALAEAAWAAVRSKGTYLSALYHRLRARKTEAEALVAVAHSVLVSAYEMLRKREPYRDLGADYFDRLRPQNTTKRLVKHLEKLGYEVTLSLSNRQQVAN